MHKVRLLSIIFGLIIAGNLYGDDKNSRLSGEARLIDPQMIVQFPHLAGFGGYILLEVDEGQVVVAGVSPVVPEHLEFPLVIALFAKDGEGFHSIPSTHPIALKSSVTVGGEPVVPRALNLKCQGVESPCIHVTYGLLSGIPDANKAGYTTVQLLADRTKPGEATILIRAKAPITSGGWFARDLVTLAALPPSTHSKGEALWRLPIKWQTTQGSIPLLWGKGPGLIWAKPGNMLRMTSTRQYFSAWSELTGSSFKPRRLSEYQWLSSGSSAELSLPLSSDEITIATAEGTRLCSRNSPSGPPLCAESMGGIIKGGFDLSFPAWVGEQDFLSDLWSKVSGTSAIARPTGGERGLNFIEEENPDTGLALRFIPTTPELSQRWRTYQATAKGHPLKRFADFIHGEGVPGILELSCPPGGMTLNEYKGWVDLIRPTALRLFACDGPIAHRDRFFKFWVNYKTQGPPMLITSESSFINPRSTNYRTRLMPFASTVGVMNISAVLTSGLYSLADSGYIRNVQFKDKKRSGLILDLPAPLGSKPREILIYSQLGLVKKHALPQAFAGGAVDLGIQISKDVGWLRIEIRGTPPGVPRKGLVELDYLIAATPYINLSRLGAKQ